MSLLSKCAYLCHMPISPSYVYVVEKHSPNGFVLYPKTLVMHNDDTLTLVKKTEEYEVWIRYRICLC